MSNEFLIKRLLLLFWGVLMIVVLYKNYYCTNREEEESPSRSTFLNEDLINKVNDSIKPYFSYNLINELKIFLREKNGENIVKQNKQADVKKFYSKREVLYIDLNCEYRHLSANHNFVTVDRKNILKSSFNSLKNVDLNCLRANNVYISFKDEIGQDVGGLSRDWLNSVLKSLLDNGAGLFVQASSYPGNIIPKCLAQDNYSNLIYYKFLGRLLGLLIVKKHNYNIQFEKLIYKKILNIPCTISDYCAADSEFFNNLVKLKSCEEALFEFTTSSDKELLKGGQNIKVVKDNVNLYIVLTLLDRYEASINTAVEYIKKGFYDIIPQKFLSNWNADELELLLCGKELIDISYWKRHTQYEGYLSNDKVIVWFWKYVETLSDKGRSHLLNFVTACTRISADRSNSDSGRQVNEDRIMTISRVNNESTPTASTCIKILFLPCYKTEKKLNSMFNVALKYMERCGFAIV